MATGIANTPLINYFRYKQSTAVSGNLNSPCFPITAIADGGNGQLVITAGGTDTLEVGVAITIAATTNYDGNYTVISVTATTFNVSGVFGVSETGTWELASNITGANAGEPLDAGQIFFFDNDNQTVLQDTFSDRDLTITNTNPIILDAVGSAPPIYLLDQPYFIEIFDKFNNLVATLDNYLPDADETPVTAAGNIENLFPNYGFDSTFNSGDFVNNSLPSDTPANAISSGWFWEISTTQTDPNNTYSFVELGNSTLIGNPKNEVILDTTNNTTGDSLNNLYTLLGDYNSLQNTQLAISIFVRRIAGSVSNLVVQLRRTKNGTTETAITVGNIPVSSVRTQQIISFTVPALTTSDYANDDQLQLLFNLPLNDDFEIGFTGMWCQLSSDGTVDINESAISKQAAKEVFGHGFRQLQSGVNSLGDDSNFNILGLPLMIGSNGHADLMTMTGAIFVGKGTYNYATNMSSFPGTLLVADQVLKQTSTTRLITYLRNKSILQSRNTFIATKVSSLAEVDITTGIGGAQLNASSANAGGRVTIAKTVDELIYALSAQIGPSRSNDLAITFRDQFAPGQTPHVFNYNGSLGPLYGTPPTSHPIVSWVGNTYRTPSTGDGSQVFVQATFVRSAIHVVTNDSGSGSENATVTLAFSDESAINYTRFAGTGGATNNPTPLLITTPFQSSVFINNKQSFQAVPSIGGANQEVNIFNNYLSYNDISDNPSTQPNPPVRSIRFSVNGDLGENTPTGSLSHLTISIRYGDNAKTIAFKTSNAINTAWTENIVIVSTPTNGDNVNISNLSADFIIIYFDTTQTKPANPIPARNAIFVEFTPSNSLEDIATATATAIESSSAGIPYAPDLGLEIFTTGEDYFMVN